MMLFVWLRAIPLFGFSFVEMTVSFVRAIILTHILGPYEFGFSVAISVTYAAIEQISDLAIYRYVSSSPRSIYNETLAAAHALSILRGILLGFLILIVSYPSACTLAQCNEWSSFAWLAPVAVIRSLEHLEIRIRERDYRYWPQLIASIASHSIGLIAMAIAAYQTRSHYAFIVYLLVQTTAYVFASHRLATSSYQLSFAHAHLRKALAFGLPLAINGLGLALIAQGDRLMVGALMGLHTLGLYAVLVLAGTVPAYGLFRILGPLQFAGLHNVPIESSKYRARLRLFGRALPLIAGSYALALIALLKPALPFIFGPQFAIEDPLPLLVGMIAFLRIVRIEPHTTLLLHTQNTKKLAIANLTPGIGLFLSTAFVIISPEIKSVLLGTLLGECIGLCVMVAMTRTLFASALADYITSFISALFVILMGYAAMMLVTTEDTDATRAIIAACCIALFAVGASLFLIKPFRAGYGAT